MGLRTSFTRCVLASTAMLFASACGSSSDAGPSGGGGGSGGSGGSGGGAGAGSKDKVPPVFAGVTSAVTASDTRITLAWEPAKDDVTAQPRISYAVYAGPKSGAQDFSKPLAIVPAGSGGALMSELVPGSNYFFVVRARDEAGNEDKNSEEANASTTDQGAPRFAGIIGWQARTARSVLASWRSGKDAGSPDRKLVYRVYVSDTRGMEDFKTPLLETKPGVLSALIDHADPASPTFQLEPQTTYYAVVRAVDAEGNEDDNTVELPATTLEGVLPTFAGARLAAAEPGDIRLYWSPANDLQPGPDGKPTGTEAANIVYEIFQGTSSGGEDLSKPTYVSSPAALDFLVPDSKPGQRYYFIVRALDSAGNDDGNTVEVSAQAIAPSDTTSPAFGGVTSVVGTSPSSLKVSWSPATDPPNAPASIAYDVYYSDTSKGQNFSAPNLSTAPGATSAEIVGLQPGVTRFVVVRARDAVGNELSNTTEASGATLAATADSKAPVFNGGITVSVPADGNPFGLDVDWAAATDDTSAAADIRYHVCAEAVETNCVGAAFGNHVRTVTDWGVSNATTLLLDSRTRYYVYVRAEDRGGNMETGNHAAFATSLTAWSRDVQPLIYQKCGSCHDYYVSPVSLNGVSSSFIDPKLNPSTEIGTVRVCTGTNNTVCTDQPGQVSRIKLVKPGHPELSSIYRRINHLGTALAPFSGAVPNNYSGLQEPRDGASLTFTPLSPDEDAKIRDWITQGAYAF